MPACVNARRMSSTSLSSSSTSSIAVPLPLMPILRQREFDPEAAALPRRRLDAGTATHPLRPFADDREPDPRSGILIRSVQPLEDAKHPFVMLGRDADAVVLHPEPQPPAAALRPHPHL